jgi:hypothetical protein
MIISAKQLGRKKPSMDDWEYLPPEEILEPGDGGLTLRELLMAITRDEVAAYNKRQKKQQLTHVLMRNEIARQSRKGKISTGGIEETQLADCDEAVAETLQAFEDGLYLVFLDEVEQTDLDAQVFVSPESTLVFVKLTFLTG